MKKLPNKLRIFGEDWTIKWSQKKDTSSFSITGKYIMVARDHGWEGFFHEVFEMLMVKNFCRFYGQEGSMEYHFFMDHTKFAIVAMQAAEIFKENNLLK